MLLLLGLAILFYPSFSNWWNSRRAARLISEYQEIIETIDTQDLDKMIEDALYYNGFLVGNVLPDAFLDEEANTPNASYESLINLYGNGVMGTVEIPCINVDLPVYHYTREDVLQKGVGHLPGSSLPVGGTSSHCVLSAHRGLPSAKLFTDLNLVEIGDIFYVHVLGQTLAYEADLIKIIEPTDTKDLQIVEGEDYCTLFTCHPYAVNTHRLLVRGHRVEYSEEVYEEQQSAPARVDKSRTLATVLCVVGGVLIAGLIIFLVEFRRRRKAKKAADFTDISALLTEEDFTTIDFGDSEDYTDLSFLYGPEAGDE